MQGALLCQGLASVGGLFRGSISGGDDGSVSLSVTQNLRHHQLRIVVENLPRHSPKIGERPHVSFQSARITSSTRVQLQFVETIAEIRLGTSSFTAAGLEG